MHGKKCPKMGQSQSSSSPNRLVVVRQGQLSNPHCITHVTCQSVQGKEKRLQMGSNHTTYISQGKVKSLSASLAMPFSVCPWNRSKHWPGVITWEYFGFFSIYRCLRLRGKMNLSFLGCFFSKYFVKGYGEIIQVPFPQKPTAYPYTSERGKSEKTSIFLCPYGFLSHSLIFPNTV